MSKIFQAFNIVEPIRIKTFELGGHTFKVNVPLQRELEAMYARIEITSEDRIKANLERLKELSDDVKTEDGTSKRDIAVSMVKMENRVLENFRLLIPETGSMDEFTYEDIDAEFPLQVQLELANKISEVISPGYKEARKN